MNDDVLATEISRQIPPEAAIAARTAQLERHFLELTSQRLEDYHDTRDHNHDTNTALGHLNDRITELERATAEQTNLLRDYRLWTVLGGIALTAALIATWILR